ncbi:MAG: hypothetical protein NTU53_17955 [Planctomycetota bacterium]|nr:hypothetical protein [Planctomycetota bacterium]
MGQTLQQAVVHEAQHDTITPIVYRWEIRPPKSVVRVDVGLK